MRETNISSELLEGAFDQNATDLKGLFTTMPPSEKYLKFPYNYYAYLDGITQRSTIIFTYLCQQLHLALVNKHCFIYPSAKEISEKTGIYINRVYDSLNELDDKKLIFVVRLSDSTKTRNKLVIFIPCMHSEKGIKHLAKIVEKLFPDISQELALKMLKECRKD